MLFRNKIYIYIYIDISLKIVGLTLDRFAHSRRCGHPPIVPFLALHAVDRILDRISTGELPQVPHFDRLILAVAQEISEIFLYFQKP